MSESASPPFRPSSRSDLAELVPYLVGFEPRDSLVVLVMHQGYIALSSRADLADVSPPRNAENVLDRLLARFPEAHGLYLMAYTDQPRVGWDVLARCEQHLGHKRTDSMLINGDTWYAADGATGAVSRSGTMAAQATFRGLQRRGSREALAADLASPPDSPTLHTQLRATIESLADMPGATNPVTLMDHTQTLITDHLRRPETLATADALRLAVLTLHHDVRDAAVLSITLANAAEHRDLWTRVVQQVPASIAEAPLFLAGMSSWISGEGARAAVALERLQADPRPVLAGARSMLAGIIRDLIPPQEWSVLRHHGLRDVHPFVRAAATRHEAIWESVQPAPLANGSEPPARTYRPRPGPSI